MVRSCVEPWDVGTEEVVPWGSVSLSGYRLTKFARRRGPGDLAWGIRNCHSARVRSGTALAVSTSRFASGGNSIEPMQALRRLRDLRPPTEDDCLTLARLAMSTGRTDEALAEFAQVTDGHSTAALARLWEGQLELRLHRARAAEASLKRAIAINPAWSRPDETSFIFTGYSDDVTTCPPSSLPWPT